MKKAILVAMALATMTSAPVLAQTYRAANDGGPMTGVLAPSNAGTHVGHGAFAAAQTSYATGPAVYSYDRYAGWDPDPSIRLMLERDATGTDAQ